MERKFSRNHPLGVIAVSLLAIMTLLAVAVVLAQTSGAGQTNGKAHSVLATVESSAPAQAERPLTPWTDGAVSSPVRRSRAKRHGASPMDGNPPFFLPPVNYDSGGGAAAIAIADVNGDHQLDLLVANGSGLVGVLLGNGDGTFKPVATYNSNGSSSSAIAVADLNHDGKLDVIVQQWWDWETSVLLGNGDGSFQPGFAFLSEGDSWVTTADLNRDGNPDLVVTNWCYSGTGCPYEDGSMSVLLGEGTGYFYPIGTYDSGGQETEAVAVGDLNGDGNPDIVVANACTSQRCTRVFYGLVSVFMGHGNGSFDKAVSYPALNHTQNVVIADVNGDGIPDLVVNSNGSGVGVLLGWGNGTFRPVTAFDSGGYTGGGLAVADVDGDGKLDIIVENSPSGTIAVLRGNGDGTFQSPVVQDCGGCGNFALAVADLNGDGRPDLVVGNGGVGVMMHVGATPTTTTVVSSLNPSVLTQSIVFTATVTSTSGTPTGSAAFFDGTTNLGTATLASGTGSLSVSTLSGGSHSITAVYQGSLQFKSGASAAINQIVNPEASTTSLVSTLNPALLNESVTYTATVASQYGGAVTGTVVFQDGGSTVATVTMTGNQAAYTTSYRSAGAHSITATYSGDTDTIGSASAALVEQINKGLLSKTVMTTSGSPSLVGQPVTFTATVTSRAGAIPDGELVTFYDGTIAIGTGTTASGVAKFVTSSLLARTHTIKGVYAGDAKFDGSSGAAKQVVDKYPTTTSLSSSLNPSQSGQAVTFTAQVTGSGLTAPTGKVKFMDGTVKLGLAALNGGVAKFTKSTLAAGTHPITAQYLGDADNALSTSPVVDQVVQ